MSARRAAIAALALAAFAVPGGAGPAQACGCGIALESSVSDERALVVDNPGHERIVLSLDLAGDPGGRPAVVLPVPGVPEVEAIEHGDPLAYLDTATTEVDTGAVGGGAPDESAASPVDVIGRETVGGYDVARLASGDAARARCLAAPQRLRAPARRRADPRRLRRPRAGASSPSASRRARRAG